MDIEQQIERCSKMEPEQRDNMRRQVMQALIDMGMNAFGFELMAESIASHAQEIADTNGDLEFVFPLNRTESPEIAGCVFKLTPIKRSALQPNESA